jgi:hypothetical protein
VIGLPSIVVAILLNGSVDAAPGRLVLLVGDSVMAALSGDFTDAAKAIMGRDGWTVTMDARVCRKSTTPGCLHGSPTSALEVLRTRPNRQSTVVVIMVGHNDDRGRMFREKVSTILDEVGDAPHVFWVSMREVSKSYIAANQVITEEAARRPNVQVIPWAMASRHQPSWVARDGTHLTTMGAKHMALVIRQSLNAWHMRAQQSR